MKEVRTRFAPSPTGYVHIGSVRTALYAWLLARHYGGKFLLRVEDTDQERLVKGAIRNLVEELAWFGIDIDEGPSKEELEKVGEAWDGMPNLPGDCGPYIQSLRLPRYREAAEELIKKGACYRCDCTPEMLEKERAEQLARKELPGYAGHCRERNVPANTKHVIRFKMPSQRAVVLQDAVKGKVVWENVSLRDTVLIKSDGFATYHLASIVDDHDMRITHVMRGDEWLATAPLHLLIYEAFGWEPPQFAHLPVILGKGGKKLSKRDGSVFLSVFRDEGYLPQALLNYVLLIGWSPGEGEEQEVFSRKEMIERFSLDRINEASGHFDYDKLQWMNGAYVRALGDEEFLSLVRPFVEKAGLAWNHDRLKIMAPHIKERTKLLTEVPAMIDFLLKDTIERDIPGMYGKGVDSAKAKEILQIGVSHLESIEPFEAHAMEAALRPLAEQMGLKVGAFFGVFRIAITGRKVSPPLFECIQALGREIALARLRETLGMV